MESFEERSDLALTENRQGSIGCNLVSEKPVLRPLAKDIVPSEWLDERPGLLALVENYFRLSVSRPRRTSEP